MYIRETGMEISREHLIFSIIERQSSLKEEASNWLVEFNNETSMWSENEYFNFVSVMKSFAYTETVESEYMEAFSDESILKIKGISNILKYCMSDNYRKMQQEWSKERLLASDEITDLFDSRLSLKLANKQDTVEPANWKDSRKYFKINKQIVFTDEANHTRFIVNIAKCKDNTANNMYYSLKSSGTIKASQRYEFYLDITNTPKEYIIPAIIKMEQALYLSAYVLTQQQQQSIINSYHTLVKNDILVKAYNKNQEKPPLLTPKPVTLEKVNMLNPDEYGVVSILSEYTVTEKADGERLLLYIDAYGKVYLINNTYRVVDTGLQAGKEIFNSLIDGEYIACHKRKDSSTNSLYAAFDIYYYGGKKVTQLPLMDEKGESRYKYLLSAEKYIKASKTSMDFIVKEHLYNTDILKDCKKILTGNKKFLYDIDGLIFTPAKLSVYAYYANKPVQMTDNVKWDRVFKWKPPEQNSIDFLVKEGNIVTIEGQRYKEMFLYVGYNASQWENYTIDEALRIHYDKEYRNTIKDKKVAYVPKLFRPTVYYTAGVEKSLVKLTGSGETRCESGEKFETDNIVEFRYNWDESIPVSMRWIPMRIREDKTRVYKKGELSKTANDLSVAVNIWRSIHNPVSEAMITGNEPVYNKDVPETDNERLLETDDIYYSRNIPREALLSYHMLQFHNHGIKRMLYAKPKNKGSLLELACGEAGDMPRWLDNGYKFVLGVDLVKNNIYGPRSGAYSRMLNRRNHFIKRVDNDKVTYTDMVFAAGDCGKSIMNGECSASINDQESVNILKLVLNKKKGNLQKHYAHIAGQGSNGFDACSCMFSIHYFFKSEDTLDTFLDNVSSLLKKDGVFFCTFMDGKVVEDAIADAGGDLIEGKKVLGDVDKGVPVWAIIRRFNKNMESPYNKKIDVFIESTNKFIPEYVVSFELLIDKCKQHSLVLVESELFSETFNKIKQSIPDDDNVKDVLHKNVLELDKDIVQKQFSFLNRWCTFKKI
jgi:hypothetical protein